jgi:hypothetical protein
MIYHACEIYSDGDDVMILVNTDPALLLEDMAAEFRLGLRLEEVTIGRVEADSVDNAIIAVRLGEWLIKE